MCCQQLFSLPSTCTRVGGLVGNCNHSLPEQTLSPTPFTISHFVNNTLALFTFSFAKAFVRINAVLNTHQPASQASSHPSDDGARQVN